MNTPKEYKKLKAALDRDYQKRLEGLKVYFSLGKNGAEGPKESSLKRGDLTKLVLAALDNVKDEFSVVDVEKAIKKTNKEFDKSRATISTVLKRLEGKKVSKASDGKGPKPATYKLIKKPKADV